MGDRNVSGIKKSDDVKKASEHDHGTSTGSDKVTLTDTAAKLKSLESELSSQPVVNNGKVKDVQSSIQSGTYKMDPERIADKMINFESAFSDN